MFDVSFYTPDDLNKLGFKSLGRNVKISKASVVVGAGNISIGDNTRIDAFSILSAPIT